MNIFMSNILNYGILGYGKMGKIRYRTLLQIDKCFPKTVYEYKSEITTPENLKRIHSPEELITLKDIDAVVISVLPVSYLC